jgi:peptidoglycan L-alanyl-D-glutamate endopeptidase CwlK
MSFSFGSTSRSRLDTVHPKLQKVCERALQLSSVDFMVLEGVRTPERQRQLYAAANSQAPLLADLPNYADDAAAAAGSVPVGGRYRNGSILMIRVA